MKKQVLLIALLLTFSAQFVSSQWINSITYSPANPTPADTIRFFVDLSFSSGSCDEHTKMHQLNGNIVEAYALHCLGMLTVICNYTDTFVVEPLPAGAYRFRFHVDVGGLPSPCTPGINPGPTDSTSFTVTPVTAVPHLNFFDNTIRLFPVPASEFIRFSNSSGNGVILRLFSVTGKLIIERKFNSVEDEIDISQLGEGMYFARIISDTHKIETRRIIISK